MVVTIILFIILFTVISPNNIFSIPTNDGRIIGFTFTNNIISIVIHSILFGIGIIGISFIGEFVFAPLMEKVLL